MTSRRDGVHFLPPEMRLLRALPPRSVPTYTHCFYERLYASQGRDQRFPDLPAFRNFVSYQVRFLNAVISGVRCSSASDPITIARLNHRLLPDDFDHLRLLVSELVAHQLLEEAAGAECTAYFGVAKGQLFPAAAAPSQS